MFYGFLSDEEKGDGRTNLLSVPSVDEILFFLQTVWDGQSLSAESAVMCLAYIDRSMTFGELLSDSLDSLR